MLSETADALRMLVERITPELQALDAQEILKPRGPGKWTPKEILGHLIDSAGNNQQKFVRVQQQPHLDFPGYRQDDWVAIQRWNAADWSQMIELWRGFNRHLAFVMEQIDPATLEHTITIESVGPFTLAFIVPDYVEHLKHHLQQIFPDSDFNARFVNVYNA